MILGCEFSIGSFEFETLFVEFVFVLFDFLEFFLCLFEVLFDEEFIGSVVEICQGLIGFEHIVEDGLAALFFLVFVLLFEEFLF